MTALPDTFKLINGDTLTGDLLAASGNDLGVQIKVGDGKYERIPWASFSQEDLKKFKQIKKLEPLVEPFIEITQEEKIQKTEVNIKPPPRLERPAHSSLLGALFSSGLGFVVLLIFYAANIYAGYEISVFRSQPRVLVCGVSAVAPVLGPILFLALPTRTKPPEASWEGAEGAEAASTVVNPMLAAGAQHPTGMRLARGEAEPGQPNLPQTAVFPRGQFTFNRRFFETKFPNFFGVIKRDADRDMVLVFKCGKAEYHAERISRITANDLHLQVHKGHGSEEVSVAFQDIQEVRLKHRNAP